MEGVQDNKKRKRNQTETMDSSDTSMAEEPRKIVKVKRKVKPMSDTIPEQDSDDSEGGQLEYEHSADEFEPEDVVG